MKNFIKKIAIALTLVISFALCFAFVGCGDKMPSKEDATYELVLDAAYKFKNPSSVRLISGKVYYYEITDELKEEHEYSEFLLSRGYYISAHLRLSATNGYGATTTGYYSISYDDDGKIKLENIEDSIKEYTDGMDKYPSLTTVYKVLLQIAVENYEECEIRNDFDIDKVNKRLDEKWSK